MATRTKLPDVTFIEGLLVKRLFPPLYGDGLMPRRDYYIIGCVEPDVFFMLDYQGGVTSWRCKQRLGDSLRKKILNKLRKEVRVLETEPDYIKVVSTEDIDIVDLDAGIKAAEEHYFDFFENIWLRKTLGTEPEVIIKLNVPYEEKDEAKALGAKWNSMERVWEVEQREDMSPFSKWLQDEKEG